MAGLFASRIDPVELILDQLGVETRTSRVEQQPDPETQVAGVSTGALSVPVSADIPDEPAAGQAPRLPQPVVVTAIPTLLPTAAPTVFPTALPTQQVVAANPPAEAPAAAPVLDAVNGQTLEQFAAARVNGQADQATGVFVPGAFALPVIQQPWNQANFVSTENDTVTQFALPANHGVISLLAHNYLSGERFFDLTAGQTVAVVYGDGRSELYQITKAQSFQALTPTSPYSNFVDLADASETQISSAELFKQVYTTSGQLVFQTCIRAYGDPSWGRLFVTAEKLN